MSSSNSSNLPRLLRSASNASASLLTESRLTRSSAQSKPNPSEPSQQPTAPVTRSRFGFSPSASTHSVHSTQIPNHTHLGAHDTNHQPSARASQSSRTSSAESASHIARPASALGRPASSLARPSSAMGRPATALGTRSQSIYQPGSRLPQSAAVPPPTRKRRTSSLSSQRPARSPARHANHPTSSVDLPTRAVLQPGLEKQLEEALEKLSSAQEECNRFRLLSEEATLRVNQFEADQNDQRVRFSQDISLLQQEHSEKVEEIQKDLGEQLSQSRQHLEHFQSTSSEELGRATAQVSRLHSEIEQMDIDSGLNAAQVIELTRLKTELEGKLEAAQKELRETNQENQKRIEQVTQHYHHIQSKLHQDLEQITADYQACLQQQSLAPSAEIVELKTKVQLMEQKLFTSDAEYQKVRSELDRLVKLTKHHEEERRGWELDRHNMQREIRELELQTEMVKRRKITWTKMEKDSSHVENQIIDFNITVGDNESETPTVKIERRSSESALIVDQQHCPDVSLLPPSAGQVDNSLKLDPSPIPQHDIKPTNEQPNESAMRQDKESSCAKDESGNLAQLNALQSELTGLKSELHTAHDMIAQLQEGHRAAQMSSEHELNSARNDLETQVVSSSQTIEELKSNTVNRQIYENVQNDLNNLRSQHLELSAQLDSSQKTIRTLNTDINTVKVDHAQEIDRLSQLHVKEIQSCAEQITQLKAELNDINRLYAQASSKLENLADFSPERVSVLISRLRSERDEARSAMEFLHVEQKAIEEASRKTKNELLMNHINALNETASERNGLVIAILTLRRTLQSLKEAFAPTKNSENILVEQSPEIKPAGMDDSLMNFNNVLFNCSTENDDDNMLKNTLVSHEQNSFESHFGNETNAQAYATALEQITTLTQQVQDLKEQLLRTYVAHQDQEKQILAELENSQQNTTLLEIQHAQIEKQQANVISSLELKFSGIQHQFQSLEVSFNSLREEKSELKIALENEREKNDQSELEKEALQSNIAQLCCQIHSMESNIQAQKEQMSALKEQLILAHQAPDLSAQVEQLTHDLQEQKRVIETLEEQLEAADLFQRDRLTTVERLEERLNMNKIDQCNELEKKNIEVILLKEEFEKQRSSLSDSLDRKLALIVRLEGTVEDLSAEIQRAHENRSHIQAKMDEKHQLLENQMKDLRQKAQVTECEREIMTNDLRTSLETQQASKDRLSSELSQTRDELAKAMESNDSMSQQLIEFQEALKQERENFKQSHAEKETLQSTIDSLGSQIQSLQETIELSQKDAHDLKQQLCVLQQSSGPPTREEHLNASLEEQMELIKKLEEQVQEAHSIQQNHLNAIQKLEEALLVEETHRRNESEQKEAEGALLTEGFERKLSKLSNMIDEKSTTITRLEEELGALTAHIQEALKNHQQIQGELEGKLAGLIQERTIVDEEYRSLEIREVELNKKAQASQLEKENLSQQLEVTFVEHQAFKDKILRELGRAKEEVVEVMESKDLLSQEYDLTNEKVRALTEELVLVKSQKSNGDKPGEAYATLSSEFQALKDQLSTVTDELESLRSRHLDMTSKEEELTTKVKEKDLMIESLKADLATVSKLHTRLSSSTDINPEKVQELETRIESKSAEAEDALDRLLDEMQKNKRLSIIVETLKVKLKSKTKAVVCLDEPVAGSGDDPMRATASGSTAEETDDTTTGSNIRKRKHESTGPSSRPRAEVGDDDSNTNKENPSYSSGRRSIRRKVSTSIKPMVLITEPDEHHDDGKLEEKPREAESSRHNLTILQPISVNQTSSTTSTSSQTKNNHLDLKSSDKTAPPPPIKTNSNLLASIQSLRRKQQLKHHASSGNIGSDTKR